MTAHTQGPWTASCVGIVNQGFGSDPYTRNVWVSGPHFVGDEMGTAVDDARLIAAAPELLEALRTIANAGPMAGTVAFTMQEIARTAVAKATMSNEARRLQAERKLRSLPGVRGNA